MAEIETNVAGMVLTLRLVQHIAWVAAVVHTEYHAAPGDEWARCTLLPCSVSATLLRELGMPEADHDQH